jgi:hypothetical protein
MGFTTCAARLVWRVACAYPNSGWYIGADENKRALGGIAESWANLHGPDEKTSRPMLRRRWNPSCVRNGIIFETCAHKVRIAESAAHALALLSNEGRFSWPSEQGDR